MQEEEYAQLYRTVVLDGTTFKYLRRQEAYVVRMRWWCHTEGMRENAVSHFTFAQGESANGATIEGHLTTELATVSLEPRNLTGLSSDSAAVLTGRRMRSVL